MVCTTSAPSIIRKIYVLTTTTILNNFSIPADKQRNILGSDYLALSVLPDEYSRIEEGEKTAFVDTFNTPFIAPKLIRVGFQAVVSENAWNIRSCLEFIAIAQVSTAYNTFNQVNILDYVRPEVEDYSQGYTQRRGLLTLEAGGGAAGISTTPSSTQTPISIKFVETRKRLQM
jgi:hypothetical protein